ncbi:MAG: hypothetical protein IJ302_02880, partial [Clostridia bacterium]|nr:hypothetical protein [Clostridia bacterium]
SRTRPPMPMSDRAAQFSPFSALTGYDDAITETARLTDEKTDLNEEVLTVLNRKYQILAEHLDEQPEITVTYFKPDERKAGGAYAVIEGVVKRLDPVEHTIVMRNEVRIPMEGVVSLDGDIFREMYV